MDDIAKNDDWTLVETKPWFVAWACAPFVHSNGSRYRYAVVRRDPSPGLGWQELVYTLPLPGDEPKRGRESAGAFYDDAEDHPEGAIEWAASWAREYGRKWFGNRPELAEPERRRGPLVRGRGICSSFGPCRFHEHGGRGDESCAPVARDAGR